VNGAEYKVGDVISLWAEDWKHQKDGPIGASTALVSCVCRPHRSLLGEIISLVTDGSENFVELKWFYNVAETSIRGLKCVSPVPCQPCLC